MELMEGKAALATYARDLGNAIPDVVPGTAGSVVFILSSDRSGSTWLGYVLGSSPESAFVGEFYRAWDPVFQQKCSWCTARGHNECEVLSDINHHPIEDGYALALTRTQKKYLIDSSKRTAWAERFISPNPDVDVHLIHLIRDPRGWYESEHRRHHDSSCGKMIDDWVRENLEIRNFLQVNRVPSTTVFYEELAGAPLPRFQRLCRQIGYEFEAAALRYWEKPHHSFAANGASFPVLDSASDLHAFSDFVSGDDSFYAKNGRQSFVDQRWQSQLHDEEKSAIRENFRASAFLNLYDRVMTGAGLHHLTAEERAFHLHLEGKFVQATGSAPDAQRIYIVRGGVRHWITSIPALQWLNQKFARDVEVLPLPALEKIPVGSPVSHQ